MTEETVCTNPIPNLQATQTAPSPNDGGNLDLNQQTLSSIFKAEDSSQQINYRKIKISQTMLSRSASKIQAICKGVLLRKKFRQKLKRFIFGKSLLAYMRRYKRKILKKPVFRIFRERFGFLFNIRINISKLEYIQKYMKARCQEKKRRRILFGRILEALFKQRIATGFKSIRSKNVNEVAMKRIVQVYSENFLNKFSSVSKNQVFHKLISGIKNLQDMKKNNFVFNYLAYSFEKGLKFYMVRWKRIIKKLALQQYYLNLEEDKDVVDLEEEKKKVAQIKENSLIVKRFRNLTYRNLRSKVYLVKNNFLKWRDNTLRLKIAQLKQLRLERSSQRTNLTSNEDSKSQVSEESTQSQLAQLNVTKPPLVTLTNVRVDNADFEKLSSIIKEFMPSERYRDLTPKTIIYEIMRRFNEWKVCRNKSLQMTLSEGNYFANDENNSCMKFTIEDTQTSLLSNIKRDNKKLYGSLCFYIKRIKVCEVKKRIFLHRWKLISNQMKIINILNDMQKDFSLMTTNNQIHDFFVNLRIKNIDAGPQNQQVSQSINLPLLNIQHHDDINRDRRMQDEDLDDYYNVNVKSLAIRYQSSRKNYLKEFHKNGSLRRKMSIRNIAEIFDEDDEDFHNQFLRKYKKLKEKSSPNFEEDVDDENHRYIVKYDKFEEDEDEKKKNEMTFEEKMALKKEQLENRINLEKDGDDDIELNCDEFDLTILSLLAVPGKIIRDDKHQGVVIVTLPENKNTDVPSQSIAEVNNETVETPQTDEVLHHAQSTRIPNQEMISPIEETSDSDTSMDELRNLKKSQKKNKETPTLATKKEVYNVAPRYMDFYNKKQSAKVESTKALDTTKLMKVTSFSKKNYLKKISSIK